MQVLVPVSNIATFRLTWERSKLKDKDKPRVDPKHLAHYTLAWITCVNNICNMHRTPKDKY